MKNQKSQVAKFSAAFIKNPRITILLSLGAIALGFFSYTFFLKREGFPQVQVPIVQIQTPYFVGNTQTVNEEITSPLETAVASIVQVVEVRSTTTENFSNIIIEFDQDTPAEEGLEKVQSEIQRTVDLPSQAQPEYRTFNAGSFDGKHDLIFTLSGDRTYEELQESAETVAEEIETLTEVVEANVIEVISTQTNPETGREFQLQTGFNRIGTKENEEINFKRAVAVGVVKKEDVGILELSEQVREKTDEIRDSESLEGITITFGGDFASVLQDQIGDLEENALGALLAVIVVLFLMIGWRASLVTAIFIPLVFGVTFIFLYLIDYTLNVITLFSLILVLGIFVDDGIVVVEAIDRQKNLGKKGLDAIYSAVGDIGAADIVGTLTTVLVFVPMLFVSGILGEFIQLIPITVIISLVVSLLIALSLIPFLSNILIPDKKTRYLKKGVQKVFEKTLGFVLYGFSKLINVLSIWTSRFVQTYLESLPLSILAFLTGIVLVVIGSLFATKLTFSIFSPPKDTDSINITLNFPPGTGIDQAENITNQSEEILVRSIGNEIDQVNYFITSANSVFLSVDLVDMETRKKTSREMVQELKNSFSNFNLARVKVDQSSAGPPPDEYQLSVQIFSPNPETLEVASQDLAGYLEDKKISSQGRVTDVLVSNLNNVEKVDSRRFVQVQAKLSDPSNTQLVLDLQNQINNDYSGEKLTSLGLEKDDFKFDLGQEGENLESFTSSLFALMAALILMYIVLVFQFNSFSQPLLIFLAIPFTFPLLFPGLYFTDNPLSFFVMLGIIALSGIVVNKTILLVDFANKARAEGKSIKEAIAQSVRLRFRPIVSTSGTAIVALFPVVLTNPFWESLALVIIFGLTSSTIVVLLLFPVYYAFVEWIRDLRRKIRFRG